MSTHFIQPVSKRLIDKCVFFSDKYCEVDSQPQITIFLNRIEFQRKSIIGNSVVANGVSHTKSAGQHNKLKNVHPPAVSVVTFSADVATLYRDKKDPEKMDELEEELSAEFDENSGFAIVINGHSLVHCLTPELEPRFLF